MGSPLHRRGVTDPQGKCEEELKAMVPTDMKADFTALARLKDKTAGEYLREVIGVHLYGEWGSAQKKVNGRAPSD